MQMRLSVSTEFAAFCGLVFLVLVIVFWLWWWFCFFLVLVFWGVFGFGFGFFGIGYCFFLVLVVVLGWSWGRFVQIVWANGFGKRFGQTNLVLRLIPLPANVHYLYVSLYVD